MRFQAIKVFVLSVILMAISSQTHAQLSSGQRSLKILDVAVEGNVTSSAATIILTSGLRVGSSLVVPGDQTQKAISKLWKLRLFSDIQILIDREVGDGVFLKIKVEEYQRLERLEIIGNDEFSEDDIRSQINLIKGQIIRPQDFMRMKRKLRSYYEEEGFMLASFDFNPVKDSAAGRVVLQLIIDEGAEVSVESISFEGNEYFDDDDLRGALDETSQGDWWMFWQSTHFNRKLYEEDKKLIIKMYQEEGFLDAVILKDSIWYSENSEAMFIQITVDEGQQTFLRDIIWKGNAVYPDTVLTDRLGFVRGDVFNAVRFSENLSGNAEQTDVSSLYLDAGYLRFMAVDEQIRVAPDTVDVVVNVMENGKSRIGHVHIRGNNKTYDKVVRRILYTWPGDYFSRAAIIRSIRELATLNYFNPETINPVPVMANDSTVDIVYNVEERSSDTFNASVGYSGTFGATGMLGLTFNNFNIAHPLSGGAGQILNFQWQFGEASRFRIFSLSFTEPWFLDTPTSVGFSLYDERQQYVFDMRRTGASVNLGRRFRWPDDFMRGDWFVRFQKLDVKDGGGLYDTGDFTQVSITQVISRNSLDSPIFPSSGSRVAYTFEISGGPLPGTVNYQKHNLSFRWFTPLVRIEDQNRLTLYTGAETGIVKGITSDPYIPPLEYYFMGGNGLQVQTKPLRGYADRSIGPRINGLVTGGTLFAQYVMELRFAVTLNPMPLYLLTFIEAGNVWLDERFFDPFNLRRSAGFGARLLIQGVGLIGFDYGYGFDDVAPVDGRPDGWHFHFQFGRGF